MSKRIKTKKVPKFEESDDVELPKDLVQNEEGLDDINLFEFFSLKNGASIIKNWSKKLSKSTFPILCELLSFVLQIAGSRIEVTQQAIESDAYDTILEEFQKNAEKNEMSFNPPIFHLQKEKSNKLLSFWNEINDAIISKNIFLDSNNRFVIDWLIIFCNCKIRIIRTSAFYWIGNLSEKLANTISKRKDEIKKMNEKIKTGNKNKHKYISNDDVEFIRNESKTYFDLCELIYQKIIIVRCRDVDEKIREMAINSLTNTIINNFEEFCDEQKLKYIGRALNDHSSANRLSALICIKNILQKLDQKEDIPQGLTNFLENYISRVIEMTKDSNDYVVCESLNCLFKIEELKLLDNANCNEVYQLISDKNEKVREAASNFIILREFKNKDQKHDLGCFMSFLTNYSSILKFKSLSELIDSVDLFSIVISMYSNLKCLHQYDELFYLIATESTDLNAQLLTKILLYSIQTMNQIYIRMNKYDDEKKGKEMNKLNSSIMKNLPDLIKAYKVNEKLLYNLIEIIGYINLDYVNETVYEENFQKLVSEIKNILNGTSNRQIITIIINSLYRLSCGNHHLNELAKKELNNLVMEYSQLDLDKDEAIIKLVTIAKFFDISDNKILAQKIIEKLKTILKLMNHNLEKTNSDFDESSLEEDNNISINNEIIVDYLECIHIFFKNDIKKLQILLSQMNQYQINEILEKYIDKYNEDMDLFINFINDRRIHIKFQSYKSISTLLSFSPIISTNINKNYTQNIELFYSIFHKLLNYSSEEKEGLFTDDEIFDYATLPIISGAISLSYAGHILLYSTHEKLKHKVKKFYKEFLLTQKIPGTKIFTAFLNYINATNFDPNDKNDERKKESIQRIAKSLVGKVSAYDFINEWAENEEEESLKEAILPFFFDLNKENATLLEGKLSKQFSKILDKLKSGEKPTPKMVMKLASHKKLKWKRGNNKLILAASNNTEEVVMVEGNEIEEISAEEGNESDEILMEEPDESFLSMHY